MPLGKVRIDVFVLHDVFLLYFFSDPVRPTCGCSYILRWEGSVLIAVYPLDVAILLCR